MLYIFLIFFVIVFLWVFRRPAKRSVQLLDMETKSLEVIETNRINDRIKGLKTLDELKSENSSFWGEYK